MPPQTTNQWECVVGFAVCPVELELLPMPGKMALENSPGPGLPIGGNLKPLTRWLWGWAHVRKCTGTRGGNANKSLFNWIKSTTKRRTNLQQIQAHIPIAATICQHKNKTEKKRANHLIELSESSSMTKVGAGRQLLVLPADTFTNLPPLPSSRTGRFGTHWPRYGIAMKNLVYYKLAKIFQLICPSRRVRNGNADGASLLAKRQGHARFLGDEYSGMSNKRARR